MLELKLEALGMSAGCCVPGIALSVEQWVVLRQNVGPISAALSALEADFELVLATERRVQVLAFCIYLSCIMSHTPSLP